MSQALEQPTTHPPTSNSIPTSAESALQPDAAEPTVASINGRMRWTIGTILSWTSAVLVTAGLAGLAWCGRHRLESSERSVRTRIQTVQ